MKCSQCKGNKLSNEFPSSMVTNRCKHIPSFCLSCLVEKLNLTNITNNEIRKCPGPECSEELSPDEKKLLLLAWNKAPFKIDVENIGKVQNIDATDGNNTTKEIYIILLNGQKFTLQYNQIKNIFALRQEIKKELNIDESKQKLIYNGVVLQDGVTTPNTLQDYNIGPGSYIQLIVILYNITHAESIKDLTFDLFWGYPANGRKDYLDGSCLLYKGNEFFRKYDYASQYYPLFPHMSHSGDLMDDANKTGHHCITANLDKLPADVTQLYFVLSSFRCPKIGHFTSHRFELIDKTKPDESLCAYKLELAANSQAVVMCCVSRDGKGWNVIQIGKLSGGNAENYDPIKNSIAQCSLFIDHDSNES